MPGLRERNKARTRAEIRRHALRLFQQQGYPATTVEQIAAAAEVSPSTFFRYFPTKEDVVLRDDLDPLMVEAFHAQPRELTPLQAIRGAILSVFRSLAGDQLAEEADRQALIQSVPELRARTADALVQAIHLLADAVAERTGRSADDLPVQALAGAVVGVALAVMPAPQGRIEDRIRQLDDGLALLEGGLSL